MLKRNDFIGGLTGMSFTEDEPLIDIAFEGLNVDGQSILELFYTSTFYEDIRLDFGGGVMAITCRDVIEITNEDAYVLREQLGLRNTKQNNALCKDLIDLCLDELASCGFLF